MHRPQPWGLVLAIRHSPLEDDLVDPRDTLPELIVWSIFNITGTVTMGLVLVSSLCIPHLRRVPLLLNLEFILFYSCTTGSILTWTGHALDKAPPSGLCVFNAVATLSNPPAAGFAAFGLVIHLWSQAMLSNYPGSQFLHYVKFSLPWFLLPYITSIPLFIASLVHAIKDPSAVHRTSFNCSFNKSPIHAAGTLLAALSTFLVLVFTVWTTCIIARARWRTRQTRTRTGRTYYRLLVRVLCFGVCVSAAFVCGTVQLVLGFSDVWPDLVVAWVFGFASFIFGSQKDVLRLLLCCSQRKQTFGSSLENSQPPHTLDIVGLDEFSCNDDVAVVVDSNGVDLSPKASVVLDNHLKNDAADLEQVWHTKLDN